MLPLQNSYSHASCCIIVVTTTCRDRHDCRSDVLPCHGPTQQSAGNAYVDQGASEAQPLVSAPDMCRRIACIRHGSNTSTPDATAALLTVRRHPCRSSPRVWQNQAFRTRKPRAAARTVRIWPLMHVLYAFWMTTLMSQCIMSCRCVALHVVQIILQQHRSFDLGRWIQTQVVLSTNTKPASAQVTAPVEPPASKSCSVRASSRVVHASRLDA